MPFCTEKPHGFPSTTENFPAPSIDWKYRELKKRSGTVENGERRLYLHLYFNDQKAFDDKAAFNALLDNLEQELLSGNRNPEHAKLYTKYYDIGQTPVRDIVLAPKQEATDEAEKNYGFFTSVSSEENLEGKLFVQFVALIYLSHINKIMSEQNLYKEYTLHELLDDLDVIECFEQPGHRPHVGEITKKQMELYKSLGIETPTKVKLYGNSGYTTYP